MPNILILLLLFTNSISSYGAEGIVKVAVVHSYTSEFKWTSKIEKGFFVKLGSELPFQIVYRGELDAKRNPQGVRSRAGIIKSDLEKTSFDLLFVTDDDAFELLGKAYFNSNVKVVFAGVNSTLEEYGKTDQEVLKNIPLNVSGVLERYEVRPLVRLIQEVIPTATNAIFLLDESTTSSGVLANINREIGKQRNFGKLVISKVVRSNRFSLWQKTILSAKRGDVLIVFPYSNVLRPESLGLDTPEKFAKWIVRVSKVPEFATANLSVSHGFFATVGINPVEHGEDAAIAFLSSQNKSSIYSNTRILNKNYARLRFNADRAKALNLPIPFELLAYSHALTIGDIE